MRRLIHLRYLRAVVVSVCGVAALLSLAALALEIRFGVSHQAVVGYFARTHHRAADLEPLLRDPRSSRRIAGLVGRETMVNPGGLVYAVDGALEFHPHLTKAALATRSVHRENSDVFPRLASLYLRGDFEGLVRALEQPGMKARLARERVDPRTLGRLRQRLEADPDASIRGALRQETARLVLRFATWETRPFELGLGEKLRFYDANRPRGEFVGIFEVHAFRLGWNLDEEYARGVSAGSHYLAILPGPQGELLVRDFYRGEERGYLLSPVQLFESETFYRVAASG